MRDVRLIHFFLPLAEADLHYLHARMADGLGGQGRHDELAVRYALPQRREPGIKPPAT